MLTFAAVIVGLVIVVAIAQGIAERMQVAAEHRYYSPEETAKRRAREREEVDSYVAREAVTEARREFAAESRDPDHYRRQQEEMHRDSEEVGAVFDRLKNAELERLRSAAVH
jgi:hypothetical protein